MAMTERQAVTAAIFGLTVLLLGMAVANPILWKEEVFKVVLQAVVLTGVLNMVLAFHFAANKQSEVAAQNTGKAFEAITAAQNSPAPEPQRPDVILEPGETAQAAPQTDERTE